MAELTQLGSLDSEKWLDIPGFTEFRPVFYAMKCHTVDSSQISHLCRLFFCQYSFSRHLRFVTTGEDRNKDQFKSRNLCGLWMHPFRYHGAIKLTQSQGRIQGWATGAIASPKTYESIFIHPNFYNSENNIRDISPFCHLLFCHSSVVKCTSSLLP